MVGVCEDQWWQLYLLTPTSGDADTNPAPVCSVLAWSPSDRRPCVQSSTLGGTGGGGMGRRPSSVHFPATRRLFALKAAASAVDSCRRVFLMYLAETF